VNKKDRGLELRQRNNKWVLFDWQSNESIQSSNNEERKSGTISESKRSDPYALLMAGVVSDSAVLYETIQAAAPSKQNETVGKEEIKKPEDVNAVAEAEANKSDSTVVAAASNPVPDSATTAKDGNIDDNTVSKNQPAIVLLKEASLSDGKQITYVERSSPGDTVTIVIPYEQGDSSELVAQAKVQDQKPGASNLDTSENANDRETVDSALAKSDEDQKTASTDSSSTGSASSIVLMNSDCRQFATDNDVDKLRVSMLKENTDYEKIVLARKIFRSKCFTTKQVRALTELFSGDEGKYQLFDAAYPFVSDSGNFKSLVNILQDTYYINRFKAMVRM
jgi:hypothetical protein